MMVIDDPTPAIDAASARARFACSSPGVMRGLVIGLAVSGMLWTTLVIAV